MEQIDMRCQMPDASVRADAKESISSIWLLASGICFSFCFLLFAFPLCAQVSPLPQDSIRVDKASPADTLGKVIIEEKGLSRHQRAALYSAILPGLGQAYNRQYYKLPIIYGAAITLGYFLVTNQQAYALYRDELIYRLDTRTDANPDPRLRFTSLTQLQVLRLRDRYRRDRDFTIIISGLIYLLQIADAHVFSHLLDFNVSNDLSIHTRPAMHPGGAAGLSLTLSIR